jgi:MoxR-like ATPase
MSEWKIFQGTHSTSNRLADLPPAPSWRHFAPGEQPSPLASPRPYNNKQRGETFQLDPEGAISDAVNAALYLRRPLLITGKPGAGKSSVIHAVAYELQMGDILRWSITSRTTLRDGLYQYDALGRLNEGESPQPAQPGAPDLDPIGKFFSLGPLGSALVPTTWPRALLIDEIDKSDLDLPNDLLNIFEEGEFRIPELERANRPVVKVKLHNNIEHYDVPNGYIKCRQFPFVVLTSNGEREFPAPFLRRCIQLTIAEPLETQLTSIVEAHFKDDPATKAATSALISEFLKLRSEKELATDQLLNAVYLTLSRHSVPATEHARLKALVLKALNG